MKVKFDFNANKLLEDLTALKDVRAKVMPKVFETFYNNTPVRKGNAKSRTRLVNGDIVADYAYAGVLDAGRGFRDGQVRGSTQAPKGMSEPALARLDKELSNYIEKNTKG
jgi:hypothetical protein